MELLTASTKIIQAAGVAIMLYDDGTFRQVYTDGRKPPAELEPLYMGYSVGRWEAGALVVDTVGLTDKSWLDAFGHPHSDALHVTERLRRKDFGHMDVELTVDDPKTYAKPFTVKFGRHLLPDTDTIEYVCNQDEKDLAHLK